MNPPVQSGQVITDTVDGTIVEPHPPNGTAPVGSNGTHPARVHEVTFYKSQHELTTKVTQYLADGYEAGEPLLVIARESNWSAFVRAFEARGIDVVAARHDGRIITFDAIETLDAFMRDGMPDVALFAQVVGARVKCACERTPQARVRVYGEMVDVLWRQGSRDAALRLEELWNDLQRDYDFQLLCAYALGGFVGDVGGAVDVAGTHSHATLLSTTSDGATPVEPSGPVGHGMLSDAIARFGDIAETSRATVEALRAREEVLTLSEAQLRLVTDTVPGLLSFIDTEERYQFVNGAYERWFGVSRDQVIGKTLAEVLGEAAYATIQPHVKAALAGNEVTYEIEVPYRDGGPRYIEASYIPKRSPQGRVSGFVAHVTDVSKRKELERARQAESVRTDRLLTITTAIADAVTGDEVYGALVDRVVAAIGASSGGLWLLDESSGIVRLARSVGYARAAVQQLSSVPLDMEPGLPILDSIRQNAPLWISSKAELLAAYPHLASVTTPERRYTVACLPLSSQGRVLGGLGLTIEGDTGLTSEERGFLMVIARYAAQALERLRLFEAERVSRAEADAAAHRLRVMARISRAFVEADLAMQARLNAVTTELSAALGGCINIALLGPDQRLHFAATRHPVAEADAVLQKLTASAPLELGSGVTGMIAATQQAVLLPRLAPEELEQRAPVAYREFLRQYPAYALVGVPLTVHGRIIGTVTATRVFPGHSYDADDLSLFEELADRAAVAIENSRLYEETVRARKRADLLYGFAHAVSTSPSLDEVYAAALSTIEAALGTGRLAILTIDSDNKPRFRAWRGLSDAYRAAVDGHSPWAPDATRFEALLVPDAHTSAEMAPFVHLFQQEGIRALGFFPLVNRGRLLGKFMVYFDTPHEFESSEVELASSIGHHLASVITRFQAIHNLQDTIKANELFAAVLAHDLRNPLGAIMNSAQAMLMRQEGTAVAGGGTDARPLGRILRSGQRMTMMIDQLLDFARIRSGGGLHLQPRAVVLTELCSLAIGELELANPGWRIRLESRGNCGGVWDEDRLLQVISNVIGNAGHHGTRGHEVVVDVDGTAANAVSLTVRNEGVIPDPVRASLFEPFLGSRRAHESGSSGLGLGLYIVREIVKSHGGSARVTCTASETIVEISLPRVTRVQVPA